MALKDFFILDATVVHHRFFPLVNKFIYRLYYLILPVKALEKKELKIAVNRFSVHSFYYCDHGYRDERAPSLWLRDILKRYQLDKIIDFDSTLLVTFPRIFGFVFNPVSFWLCYDREKRLRTVVYEVNNTFGESHSYITFAAGYDPIGEEDLLRTEKLFHVSPFLEREGHYTFRIKKTEEMFGAWIDFYDNIDHRKLTTSLSGKIFTARQGDLQKYLKKMPFVTLKAIFLIHFQAIGLLLKRVKYINKPAQMDTRVSPSQNLDRE